MEKETLLEKAKKQRSESVRTQITEEVMELAMAWVRGDVTLGQCCKAVYGEKTQTSSGGNLLYKFATAFKEAYRLGKITIKK